MQDTEASKLADEYLRLGGKRLAKLDDNKVSTRNWEGDPDEAKEFWEKNIETLSPERRKEVETLLPSMNDK